MKAHSNIANGEQYRIVVSLKPYRIDADLLPTCLLLLNHLQVSLLLRPLSSYERPDELPLGLSLIHFKCVKQDAEVFILGPGSAADQQKLILFNRSLLILLQEQILNDSELLFLQRAIIQRNGIDTPIFLEILPHFLRDAEKLFGLPREVLLIPGCQLDDNPILDIEVEYSIPVIVKIYVNFVLAHKGGEPDGEEIGYGWRILDNLMVTCTRMKSKWRCFHPK